MKFAQIFALGTLIAMLSLLFGGGCATTRPEIDVGGVIAAAADAADGNYGSALQAINQIIVHKRKSTTNIDQMMIDSGFTPIMQVFFDGAEVEDYSRFSGRIGYFKDKKGKDAVLMVLPPDTADVATSKAFDEAARDLAEALEKAAGK